MRFKRHGFKKGRKGYKKGIRTKYGVKGRMKGKRLRKYGNSRGGIRL